MIKFKIETNIWHIKEQFIGQYAYIRCMSTNCICNASRDKIAKALQLNRVSTVSNYSKKLEEFGLINRRRFFTKEKQEMVEYKINEVNENFVILTSDLFDYELKADEIGLLVKLASIREKWTNVIRWSKSAICRDLKCTLESFNKKLAKYIELGLIEYDGKIFHLNECIAPVITPIIKLSKDKQDEIKEILANKDKYPIKIYNQIKDYCEKKLYYCTTANKMFDNIMSGFVKNNKI